MKITRKEYAEYLNSLGYSLSSDEFIIGGKRRKGMYGNMVRKHDPTAFETGFYEYKTEKQFRNGNTGK